MQEEDVFELYKQMLPLLLGNQFNSAEATQTFCEFQNWKWEYGRGIGERAQRFNSYIDIGLNGDLDEYIGNKLHRSTWQIGNHKLFAYIDETKRNRKMQGLDDSVIDATGLLRFSYPL
jgi:predicted oxidoreductase (fatty acid repression mutant protein)